MSSFRPRWRTRDKPMLYLFGLTVGVCALLAIGIPVILLLWRASNKQAYNDFAALWSFGHFVAAGHAAQVYDAGLLHPFQFGLIGIEHNSPYAYPPFFLLLLWPLGLIGSFGFAWLLWDVVTFGFYVAAIGERRMLPLLAIMPSTAVTAVYGQTGFLAAALLIGGFRTATTRPMLSGVLFGLLAFKPQLGLLVPVALLAAGLWRPIVSACATVLLLVAISSLAFAPAIWTEWVAFLPSQWALQAASAHNHVYMPTIAGGLLLVGVSDPVARGVQLCATLVVMVLVWIGGRRGMRLTLIEAGIFLSTPYAFIYDMPLVTHALLSYILGKDRRGAAVSVIECAILVATALLPVLVLLWTPAFPLGSIVLVAFFVLIWRESVASAVTDDPRVHRDVNPPLTDGTTAGV